MLKLAALAAVAMIAAVPLTVAPLLIAPELAVAQDAVINAEPPSSTPSVEHSLNPSGSCWA